MSTLRVRTVRHPLTREGQELVPLISSSLAVLAAEFSFELGQSVGKMREYEHEKKTKYGGNLPGATARKLGGIEKKDTACGGLRD